MARPRFIVFDVHSAFAGCNVRLEFGDVRLRQRLRDLAVQHRLDMALDLELLAAQLDTFLFGFSAGPAAFKTQLRWKRAANSPFEGSLNSLPAPRQPPDRD